jgi:hypothetical protein
MDKISYKTLTYFVILLFAIVLSLSINSCTVSSNVSSKTGAVLWAQNCQHCHNTPPPNAFSGDQWETIGLHMQTRALITETERDKIVEFLKQSR